MGKWYSDAALEGGIAFTTTLTLMSLVSDETTPIDLTNTLVSTSLAPGDGNGDYTITDGDVSGRKVNIAEKTGIAAIGEGTPNHCVLSLDGVIHVVTEIIDQNPIQIGDIINIPTWDDEAPAI